jgi:hypothetical protein
MYEYDFLSAFGRTKLRPASWTVASGSRNSTQTAPLLLVGNKDVIRSGDAYEVARHRAGQDENLGRSLWAAATDELLA